MIAWAADLELGGELSIRYGLVVFWTFIGFRCCFFKIALCVRRETRTVVVKCAYSLPSHVYLPCGAISARGYSKQAINLDYLLPLRDLILQPLIQKGSEGVPEALAALQTYDLVKEDLESILELSQWPNKKDPMTLIESKVKFSILFLVDS